MRWLVVAASVAAAVAAVTRLRRRESWYAYGRWRDDLVDMPTVVPVVDVP